LLLVLPHRSMPLGFGQVALWPLYVCNCVGCAVYFYLARPLTEVFIYDDTLLISDRVKRGEVHLSQVSSVTGPDWTTLRRVTLQLNTPSPFGQKIVFAGRLFRAGTDARDLRRRLCAYAERQNTDGRRRLSCSDHS